MGSSLPTLPPSRYFIENSTLSGQHTGSNVEEGRVSCDSRVQVRVGEIGSCLFERFGDELHLFQEKSRKMLVLYFYMSLTLNIHIYTFFLRECNFKIKISTEKCVLTESLHRRKKCNILLVDVQLSAAV